MADRRYVADSQDQRKSVALGALTAIYHRRSGQTHVVSEPVPQILEALAEGPLCAEDLLARLCEKADSVDYPESLEARLGELMAVGLVFKA